MDVQLPDGTILRGVPDGTSKADLLTKLKTNGYDTSSLEPAAVTAGNALNSIPRQLGLTARYGMEGLANAAQIVTEPLRYLTDKFVPDRHLTINNAVPGAMPQPKSTPLGVQATKLADLIGLPSPQGANERVVGDATRLGFGAGGTSMAAGLVKPVSSALQFAGKNAEPFLQGVSNKIAQSFSSNPLQQISSAVGAGLAGGASKEAGGSELGQIVSSVVGGVAGGKAPDVVNGTLNLAKRLMNAGMTTQQLDIKIGSILKQSGVDYSQVPEKIKQSLRAEMAGSLNADKELNPAAVARLMDFKATGTTPTRGMLSLDPVQITKEQNLAKIGANSSDGQLHGLPQVQNQNNAKLIQNMNELGASNGSLMGAGNSTVGSILRTDAGAQAGVKAAYDAAGALPGANIPLDRAAFLDNIYGNLAKSNKLAFLPESVSNMLDTIAKGVVKVGGQEHHVPFDANALDNLMTTIATEQRGTSNGNVKAALSAVRKALDETPINPVKNTYGWNQLVTEQGANVFKNADAQAGTYIDALRQAKAEAAKRFSWQESGKPIEAAIGGAQPDDFIHKFVINGTLKDAKDVASNAPTEPVKNAIVAYLKDRALNSASDEVGKFSQSSFNKAFKALNESGKLPLFFSKEEINQLESVGRASSYMQAQPVGSAVNNSNSGALVLGRGYDALKGLVGKIPFGQSVVLDPLQNIEISLKNRNALNLPAGLLAQQPKQMFGQKYLAPAAAIGGLLAAP